jgi:phage terminase small subunit
MPVLKNARHEKFAQEVAKGHSFTDAYVLAGYKASYGNASTLATKVKERIEEIKGIALQKAVDAIGVSKEKVLGELAKIGFSNMLDYVTIGADGLPFCDFTAVDRDKGAAIQEVHVETKTDYEVNEEGKREAVPVRKVRFKLSDKRAALVDIGKHLGMFVEKHELEITGLGDRLDKALGRK